MGEEQRSTFCLMDNSQLLGLTWCSLRKPLGDEILHLTSYMKERYIKLRAVNKWATLLKN